MVTEWTLRKIKDGGGLTLKNGKAITYKTGWQVATDGIVTRFRAHALRAIKAYNGNCGIWYDKGLWYIDHSKRVKTKREAMEIGRLVTNKQFLSGKPWR